VDRLPHQTRNFRVQHFESGPPMKPSSRPRRGFTLIELLVVIVNENVDEDVYRSVATINGEEIIGEFWSQLF